MYEAKLRAMTLAFEARECPVRRPEGSYYALIDLSGHGARTGKEAADLLLDRFEIATIPYDAFQLTGRPRPLVRACFSVPDDDLHVVEKKLRGL